jgi:hypothetical protein
VPLVEYLVPHLPPPPPPPAPVVMGLPDRYLVRQSRPLLVQDLAQAALRGPGRRMVPLK